MKELVALVNFHLCAPCIHGAEMQACTAASQSFRARTNIPLEKGKTDEQNRNKSKQKTSHRRSKGSGFRIRKKERTETSQSHGVGWPKTCWTNMNHKALCLKETNFKNVILFKALFSIF